MSRRMDGMRERVIIRAIRDADDGALSVRTRLRAVDATREELDELEAAGLIAWASVSSFHATTAGLRVAGARGRPAARQL